MRERNEGKEEKRVKKTKITGKCKNKRQEREKRGWGRDCLGLETHQGSPDCLVQ